MTLPVKSVTSALAIALASACAPAMAAGVFDGVYAGSSRETLNNHSGKCEGLNHDHSRIVVKDSVIKFTWGVPFEVTVAADGSFAVERPGMPLRGASPTLWLKGRIAGRKMEADVGGSQCAAHLSLTKA